MGGGKQMAICSHKLFGYNLEFTRRVGYSGLYAEMIHNGRLAENAEGFYPVEYNGLKGLGQCTERIHLLPGKTYGWKVIAGERIIVRLLTEFEEELCCTEGDTGQFTSRYHYGYARFEVVSDAPIRYLSLRPADAYHGCRKDVLDAMKELRPSAIRVPGGCYAERYNWKDGLVPLEERNPVTDGGLKLLFSASNGYDGYELNIDDYVAVCRYLNTEMEYTVRLTNNDPQDAADLVEYCNGTADTPYGKLRAERGHEEPYHIRTWYIGNEMGFLTTAEEAAKLNDQFVEKMRNVDPDIHTVVSTGNSEQWDEEFFKHVKFVDACAQHYYLIDYLCAHMPDWNESFVFSAPEEIVLKHLERAAARSKGKKIRFDEWNIRWGCSGDSVSAIYAAGIMTMLINHAERLNLESASYFAIVNEGAIRVYPDHVRLAPDGEVLKRMVNHAGGEIEDTGDETCVRTIHEDYIYTSIYNKSVDEERRLAGIEGSYELLTPNGVWMDLTKGEGEFTVLPPASVVFIKTKRQKAKYHIREMKTDEYGLLDDFLYEAIFIREGEEKLPRSVIYNPELQVYVQNFGTMPDDICFVAEVDEKVAGAVWVRVMDDYGHVEDGVPSFAISLYEEYRGCGIGGALMKRMLEEMKRRGYKKASLSVQKDNYAAKLYRKVGFKVIKETEEEFIMMCWLQENV